MTDASDHPSAASAQPDLNRLLAESPFPGDDGTADPAVRAAIASAGGEPAGYLAAVAALCSARILIPVVATATRTATETVAGLGPTGGDRQVTSDKEAEMAVVLLQAADGRRAMLGFTGEDSLQTWDESARPVPVTIDLAARAATQEKVAALIVDVAGPTPLAIEGEVLAQLAAGHRLVQLPDGDFGWMMPAPASGATPT